MITALRWIKKPDGTRVLQYQVPPPEGVYDFMGLYDKLWQDVPTIEEKQDAE